MAKLKHGPLIAALLAACLAGCAGPSQLARDAFMPDPALQCRADRGIGGTGISTDDRGMGGTGLVAQGDERGMGGTGIEGGVLGTVTGFGSICVNGLRITYDNTTTVMEEGVAVGLDTLTRGMTVAAAVTTEGENLKATRLNILHALVGPVTANTPQTFAVMGVPVEVQAAAGHAVDELAVGDVVVIDGLQRVDGGIDATRVTRAPHGAKAMIRGAVSAALADRITVGGLSIAIRLDAPERLLGRWIAVRGTWASGVLNPEAFVVDFELQVPAGAAMSFEGYLLPQPGGGFGIRGVPVRENLARTLSRAVIGRMAQGQRIQVIGVADPDGGLRPETIIVPDWRNPLQTADDIAAETDADTAAAQRQRAVTEGTTVAPTRESLQRERGTYGTTAPRPGVTRGGVTPQRLDGFGTRPAPVAPPIRPTVPSPRPLGRGG